MGWNVEKSVGVTDLALAVAVAMFDFLDAMKRIVFSLVLFAVVSVAYYWVKPESVGEIRDEQADSMVLSESEESAKQETEPAYVDFESEPLAANELLIPEGAIEDELSLQFPDEGAWVKFLEKARKQGLRVISSDERLRAVRLKLMDAGDAARIADMAGELVELDFNYEVFAPLPPAPGIAGRGTVGFDQSALQWLGVPQDNATWGEGVKIAILDSGVEQHPVLSERTITAVSLTEDGVVDGGGHGTAIASIIAGGEGLGVAPAAELLSIQVLGEDGRGDSFTLAQGIVEAVDRGAEIISMSLGSFGYSSILSDAVEYAQSRNVLMVASSGNEARSEITYPARYDAVIGVAAVDASGQQTTFSNYGEGVDIAAPGVEVIAAWESEQWVSFSGTSAAVPFVVGAIAGVMSGEGISRPRAAYDLLAEYANDTGETGVDVRTGSGNLNLERVLERNEVGIVDAALADVFVDLSSESEGQVPVIMTVENRGTQFLNSVELLYSVSGSPSRSILLGPLAVGDESSYTTSVSTDRLYSDEGVAVAATSRIALSEDMKANNDGREVQFRFVSGSE